MHKSDIVNIHERLAFHAMLLDQIDYHREALRDPSVGAAIEREIMGMNEADLMLEVAE
jgi:hypothetical protein